MPIRSPRWLPELVCAYSMHYALATRCGRARLGYSMAVSESAAPIRSLRWLPASGARRQHVCQHGHT